MRLVQARLNAGFTSANAASKAFGWPQRSYIRHETGTVGFNHLAEKYAAAFGVAVEDLIGDERAVKRSRWQVRPLAHIEPNDINAITEIRRGLPPLSTNPDIANPLACGPNAFSVSGLNSSLVPKGFIAVFDPDAELANGDYALVYERASLGVVPYSEALETIAKLIFIALPAYTLS